MGRAYQKLTKTTVTRKRTNSNGKRKAIIRRKANGDSKKVRRKRRK